MIRPLTCLCALAALGSGLYLYQTKHASQLLDKQIEKTAHEAEDIRAQTRVLQAEWTLLNDPERLRQFADQYLSLKPLQPPQFAAMADLDQRLPAPRAEPPPPLPVATNTPLADPPQPVDTPALAAVADAVEEVLPLPPPPPPAPSVIASAAPPLIRLAPPVPVQPRPQVRPVAEPLQARPPVEAHPRPAEPKPVSAPPLQAMAQPVAAPSPPLQAQRPYQPPSPPPVTGSLLGFAHSNLAAPVPMPRPTPINAPQWANGN